MLLQQCVIVEKKASGVAHILKGRPKKHLGGKLNRCRQIFFTFVYISFVNIVLASVPFLFFLKNEIKLISVIAF